MKQSKGLIHKINRAFILQGLFISFAALLSIFFAKMVLEEILIKEAVKQEADYFWQQYGKDKNFPLPNTQNLTGYFNTGFLPESTKNETSLTAGFHEDDMHNYVLYITEQDKKKLYLVFDRGQVDALAAYYGLFPLAFVLITLYIALWVTYRFSRRMVSPVSWLANQVNEVDFDAKEISLIELDKIPFETDDEIKLLANSIIHLGERLDNFIERERNFTRDASHELRSPLTVIRIASDMLLSEQDLTQPAQNSVLKIKRAADDMEDLTEAFLLLARESDNALSTAEVYINDIIDEEIDRAQAFNRTKKIPINVSSTSSLLIPAPDKVISVLLGNLIRNAILYTEHGHIDITITHSSVIIKDSGIGMPEDQVEKIFSPFYRGNNTTAVGHGVGLTIVKRLSDRFGWPLRIDSVPEKGTRVEILFKAEE